MKTSVNASLGPISVSELTQAAIDAVRGDLPNVLIAIGHLGGNLCYLNVDLETALRRFQEEFDEGRPADPMEYDATIIAFKDSFGSYEIRE